MDRLKSKVYLIKRNQIRMMHERGYLLPSGENLQYDRETFDEQFPGVAPDWTGLNNEYHPDPNSIIPREPIFVFYLIRIEEKYTDTIIQDMIKSIRSVIDQEKTSELKQFIVITTETTKLAPKLLEFETLTVIDWNLLRCDLPEQVSIPKHELFPEVQRKEIIKKYKERRLPPILITDWVAIYYGAKAGDVFLVYRRNMIGKVLRTKLPFYRVIVDHAAVTTEPEEEAELQEDYDFEQLDGLDLPEVVEEGE